MNWLAHVFLSEPDIDYRLGNLLADLVRGPARERMNERFKAGVATHIAIDAFTDAHPLVKRSRARVGADVRRFSGVLVDIFYDYLLAKHWSRYSDTPLDAFTSRFYADVRHRELLLPDDARTTLDRIVAHDLLGQYQRLDGVRNSLRRLSTYLSSRWRRDFALDTGIRDLIADEAGFTADFTEFFPQLRSHVEQRASTEK